MSKILNPDSGRYVLANGRIGKRVLATQSAQKPIKSQKVKTKHKSVTRHRAVYGTPVRLDSDREDQIHAAIQMFPKDSISTALRKWRASESTFSRFD